MLLRAESTAKSRLDWALVWATLGLVVVGTVSLLSAASPHPYYPQILHRHFMALFLGLLFFGLGFGLNYQVYQDQAKPLYVFVLGIMVLVLVAGSVQRGHRSWIRLPLFSFQPVEFARVAMVLVLASFLDRRSRKIAEPSTIFWALALVGPVMALTLKQGDFASMLNFFPFLLGMLFCAGASLAPLFSLLIYGGVSLLYPLLFILCQIHYPQATAGTLPYYFLQTSKMGMATAGAVALICLFGFLVWRLSVMLRAHVKPVLFVAMTAILSASFLTGCVLNSHLKGYQRNRFMAFLAPDADILGAAYNVHQSQIAIGSGGLWGKGLFSGTQSQLGFLPERHTDFIFAVIGEEMGFWGAAGVVALYLLLIWRIVTAGRLARDRYGFLVCSGIAAMFAFHLALNVGMCLGLTPVAGIPLPLISYGGSSLAITLWTLGIVAGIYSRRYAFW